MIRSLEKILDKSQKKQLKHNETTLVTPETEPEPDPPQDKKNERLIGECLQNNFTQSSCLKVFCLPWERCVDGKCLCKLPYQCPKNGTSPVCTVNGRSFRTYCQQKSYECLNTNERFSAATTLDCRKAGKFQIDLKYGNGSKSEGTVHVRLPDDQQGKFLCKSGWTSNEANVVCKQLGFSKGAYHPLSKEKFAVPREDLTSMDCLQVTCRGQETSLAECILEPGLRKSESQKPAGVECYTESRDCTKSEFQCVNTKCIALDKACNGINDCGDLSDELCCAACNNKSFHCRSDTCILKRYQCDGEFDCINGDDEVQCPVPKLQEPQEPAVVSPLNMDAERKMIRSSLPVLQCGIEYHRRSRQKRIIGGEKAIKDQFPWQVAIRDGDQVNCGGIYIGGCWVLTAAHCVRPNKPSQYRIMLGLLDRHDYDKDVDSYSVKQVKVHEDYNPNTYENDIALIEVDNIYREEKCMAADNTVMPACIPWSEYLFKAGDKCKVSGWGREEGLAKVFHLKWGYINLMSNCSDIYKERFFKNMECAGTHDGKIDSCKGDSGGPLVCFDSHNVAYLWGIVSWGENCGLPGYPGVYTKVANYFEWISRQVGRQLISQYNV